MPAFGSFFQSIWNMMNGSHSGPCRPGCGCPLDVIQANRPLVDQAASNRGAVIQIDPPPDDVLNGSTVTRICEIRSTCAQGELLSVTLDQSIRGGSEDTTDFDVADLVWPNVRARLSWGSGNGIFQAECDFLNGTQLSIAAESLSIDAVYRKVTMGAAAASTWTAAPLNARAAIAYGNVGRNSNPARLTELVEFPGGVGNVANVLIPPFATSFTLLPVANNSDLSARVFGFGSSLFVDYDVTPTLSNTGQYDVENAFPLFNGARYIQINDGTTDAGYVFVVFALAL